MIATTLGDAEAFDLSRLRSGASVAVLQGSIPPSCSIGERRGHLIRRGKLDKYRSAPFNTTQFELELAEREQVRGLGREGGMVPVVAHDECELGESMVPEARADEQCRLTF
jgi:hypothetical protein